MGGSPEIYTSFNVTSDGVCFGGLQHIWDGAGYPIQEGLPDARPRLGGTVKVQDLKYNVPAQNGIWHAFQLVEGCLAVMAWFLCHSDVDPQREVDKILRISGSPYEPESGYKFNNRKTRAQGVFVINRYDWIPYQEEEEEDDDDDDDGIKNKFYDQESVGIVDYSHARDHVDEWKQKQSSERRATGSGVWLHSPNAEYRFARFGFNDEHSAARSFLFFSTNTYFDRTTFVGLQQTLRKKETNVERFERQLREGFDFSGIETLQDKVEEGLDLAPFSAYTPEPPAEELFGPYDARLRILTGQDLESLREWTPPLRPETIQDLRNKGVDPDEFQKKLVTIFVEQWKEPIYDLLNEMAMSYLERSILPHNSDILTPALADILFPNHEDDGSGGVYNRRRHIDYYLYPCLTQPREQPLSEAVDLDAMTARVKVFLRSLTGDDALLLSDECLLGVSAVVVHLLTEVLDLSDGMARECERYGMVPANMRSAVYDCSQDLKNAFQYSKVFWKGRV